MRVTMKEIAERAGVHQATVDKVVHNRVGVSDEVRAKVQAIIDELGYKPNPTGRVLQRQGKKAGIKMEVLFKRMIKQL
jgi:LacI family transcriptional regulator